MLKLNVTWRDRRLDYLNLREDIYQNMLPDDEKENIWKPEIGMIPYNQAVNVKKYYTNLRFNFNELLN